MANREKIVALGLGRAGCELVNRMISRKLEGVEFAVILENEGTLDFCTGAKKFLRNEIQDCKKFFAENFPDTDMIFIINIFGSEKDFAVKIARAAKSSGTLTLGVPVSSKSFNEKDVQRFKDYSDAVILSLDNDTDRVDDIPLMIVSGITGFLSQSGYVNIDFLDIKSVLFNSGTAFFGTVYAENESKIETAARNAVEMCRSLDKAKIVLLNFTTGSEATLTDMASASCVIGNKLAYDSQVIWGHAIDKSYKGVRVSLLLSFDDNGYKNYEEMFRCESYENLSAIVRNGLSEVQRFRLGSYNNFFGNALMYGSLKVIKCFLSNGYDPKELEEDGVFFEYILTEITYRDDALEVFKILFEAGITLSGNLYEPFTFSVKVTPEIYKAFIDYGWNVNSYSIIDRNMTILMYAVRKQSYEHVKVLVEAGADVNARDDKGRTPLMYISFAKFDSYEQIQKINLLLENGARADVEDNDGNCFLQVLFGDLYKTNREGCKRLLRLLAESW